MLSFVDRNYVGFRKVSVNGDWARGGAPDITVDVLDAYGRCVHLSTDAFVEFENMVCPAHKHLPLLSADILKLWNHGNAKLCRGIIATPFDLIAFEFPLSPSAAFDLPPHTTTECGTTYTDDNLPPSENPIVGMLQRVLG